MGGRGAVSGIIHRVPNYNKATIAEPKITSYCLDPKKPHYQEFVDVGYSESNPEQLKTDLLKGLTENEAVAYHPNSYGHISYEVKMRLGVVKKRTFQTVWQLDKGKTAPKFVTAYRIKR
jgi:hypothetical protein